MSSTINREALAVYRAVWRAGRTTFRGDTQAQRSLQRTLREKFDAQRKETDPLKIAEDIKMGRQVANILYRNVVQGVRDNASDRYQLQLDESRHEINPNPPFKKSNC
ncbi:hypothetical protein IWQ62_005021 [Dispira parvispora]|uniref:Mitochondrial zinc maintenance protein 1, mitochondrial n=1 Tax=Dispira parvispora TaxID=1520584 RepID=A0A9W8AR83_9FUNG|nr:hypothetical protein IWQ62_005021 [Dispira parvispora]